MAAEVHADIRVKPAVRRASFVVNTSEDTTATVRINVKDVAFAADNGTIYVPKTLEALDALSAVFAAARAELVEQGVTA